MTTTLALNGGHDGAVALVRDDELVFSYEAEKGSGRRHRDTGPATLVDALLALDEPPDIVALGGWHKVLPGIWGDVWSGYLGTEPGVAREVRLLGRPTTMFTTTHERSHVTCGVSLSSHADDGAIAVLVWEGIIGAWYRWEGHDRPLQRYEVLSQPGARYASLLAVADPSFPPTGEPPRTEHAGKLMALAGLADGEPCTADTEAVVTTLLEMRALYPFPKSRFRSSPLYDCGVDDPELHRAAARLGARLFERFDIAARRLFEPGLPLVIVGGCGLNCEWNRGFRDGGHFSSTFVPPCADDSGAAIGAAADAVAQLAATPRLRWSVYAGQPFETDACPPGWEARPADLAHLATVLLEGEVVPWVEGRAEIGPRALGHRSLIAHAGPRAARDELNRIKQREGYRPIAPACRREDVGRYFGSDEPDPHMLFFRDVTRPDEIAAVVHADGTARTQTVGAEVGQLYDLLGILAGRGAPPVVCNTSLNFNGRGFINRLGELLAFCDGAGITHALVDSTMYVRATGGPR